MKSHSLAGVSVAAFFAPETGTKAHPPRSPLTWCHRCVQAALLESALTPDPGTPSEVDTRGAHTHRAPQLSKLVGCDGLSVMGQRVRCAVRCDDAKAPALNPHAWEQRAAGLQATPVSRSSGPFPSVVAAAWRALAAFHSCDGLKLPNSVSHVRKGRFRDSETCRVALTGRRPSL